MAIENTVTIPLEEYFDLRQKAEMNTFLLAELAHIETRFGDYERRVCECENAVRGMAEWQMKNG